MRLLTIIFILCCFPLIAGGFVIQTDPPIPIGNWTCYCRIASCECKLSEAQVTVVFPENKKKEWRRYAERDIFGDKVCAAKCLLNISKVVQVKLNFLTQAITDKQEKSKTLTKKKTTTQNEKSPSSLTPGAGGVSASATAEEARNLLKEKTISQMESEAKLINQDLTTYFVLMLTKRQYGNVKLENVLKTIEALIFLNKEGKLLL